MIAKLSYQLCDKCQEENAKKYFVTICEIIYVLNRNLFATVVKFISVEIC